MSNRTKGTILGLVASLVGVAVWVLLYVFAETIASIATLLMGVLFLLVYRKINPEDNSKYPFILAAVITVVEIVASEFLSLVIFCEMNGYDLLYSLQFAEIQNAILKDIAFGLVFFAVSFAAFIAADKKQRDSQKVKKMMVNTTKDGEDKDKNEERF